MCNVLHLIICLLYLNNFFINVILNNDVLSAQTLEKKIFF